MPESEPTTLDGQGEVQMAKLAPAAPPARADARQREQRGASWGPCLLPFPICSLNRFTIQRRMDAVNARRGAEAEGDGRGKSGDRCPTRAQAQVQAQACHRTPRRRCGCTVRQPCARRNASHEVLGGTDTLPKPPRQQCADHMRPATPPGRQCDVAPPGQPSTHQNQSWCMLESWSPYISRHSRPPRPAFFFFFCPASPSGRRSVAEEAAAAPTPALAAGVAGWGGCCPCPCPCPCPCCCCADWVGASALVAAPTCRGVAGGGVAAEAQNSNGWRGRGPASRVRSSPRPAGRSPSCAADGGRAGARARFVGRQAGKGRGGGAAGSRS